jgi:hypothetical protein
MTNTKKALFWSLLLVGFGAQAEPEYPKPFEPKVIYQDQKLIDEHAGRAPRVVAPVSPVASKPAEAPVKETAVKSVEAEAPAAAAKSDSGPGTQEIAIGAAVLGLVGFFLWNSRPSKSAGTSPSSGTTHIVGSGHTGVDRYVANVAAGTAGTNGVTGVGRYLNELEVTARTPKPATGVSKYLTGLQLSERLAAKESRVASYLKALDSTPK